MKEGYYRLYWDNSGEYTYKRTKNFEVIKLLSPITSGFYNTKVLYSTDSGYREGEEVEIHKEIFEECAHRITDKVLFTLLI